MGILKSQKDKKDDAQSNLILKNNVDVCKALQGNIANFMTKVILETYKDSVNFPLKCPFKKLSIQANKPPGSFHIIKQI